MSAEVKSVLAELIDTTTDEIGILDNLIASEHDTEVTELQAATLEEVRNCLTGTLAALKTARTAFEE